jgi:hypothetical protein
VVNETVDAMGFEDGISSIEENAIISFFENIAIKLKTIDDFKLTAQIIEKDGNNYSFAMGNKPSAYHLNKSFFLSEYTTDKYGKEKLKRKGYALITKEGGNGNYTVAKRIYGPGVSVGDIIVENVREGYEPQIGISIVDNSHELIYNITGERFSDGKAPVSAFNSTVHGFTFCLNADISYVTGIRNLWYETEGRFQSVTELYDYPRKYDFSLNVHWRLSKRYNLQRLYLGIGSGSGWTFGQNINWLKGTNVGYDEYYDVDSSDYVQVFDTSEVPVKSILTYFGIFFAPSIEAGIFITNNTKFFCKAGLQIYPGTFFHHFFIKDSTQISNLNEIRPYDEYGMWAFSPAIIKIGFTRTVSVVPRSWGFMNFSPRNKKKKIKIHWYDWLFFAGRDLREIVAHQLEEGIPIRH